MSLAVDSSLPDPPGSEDPVDDFAGFLDEVLDSDSDSDEPSFQSPKRRKLEVDCNGSSSISNSEVLKVENDSSVCEHLAGSYKDLCLICGQRLDRVENEKSELEELRVKIVREIDQGKRNAKTRELLQHKKLHLVLDLDHTLLNTTAVAYLTPQEQYLLEEGDHKPEDVYVVRNLDVELVTKLRPFVGTFLKEAAEMFELSVYTMGDRPYAQQMVKLLDTENVYFGDRVVSRDDSTKMFEKNLDVVCAKESAVLVLDDTLPVWIEQNQENVILMQKYLFFRTSYDISGFKQCMSHSELKTDEGDKETQRTYLEAILQLLRRIHDMFFDGEVAEGDNLLDRDVRQVLESLRSQVLKGCKIAFGCVLASETQADLWNMAVKLGAVCSPEVMDSSVTHVIETDAETQNSKWALKEKKFLVHPQWIQAASFIWHKQPEHRFFDDEVMCDKLIDRDVKKVLENLRGSVLGGCKIAFGLPLLADKLRLWKMAERLGATCVEQIDSSVTHVVAAHNEAPESRWAIEEKKSLVYPSWIIEASHCMWRKCCEEKFPVFQDHQIWREVTRVSTDE